MLPLSLEFVQGLHELSQARLTLRPLIVQYHKQIDVNIAELPLEWLLRQVQKDQISACFQGKTSKDLL